MVGFFPFSRHFHANAFACPASSEGWWSGHGFPSPAAHPGSAFPTQRPAVPRGRWQDSPRSAWRSCGPSPGENKRKRIGNDRKRDHLMSLWPHTHYQQTWCERITEVRFAFPELFVETQQLQAMFLFVCIFNQFPACHMRSKCSEVWVKKTFRAKKLLRIKFISCKLGQTSCPNISLKTFLAKGSSEWM